MTEKVNTPYEETETTWNYSKFIIGDWVEMYTTDKAIMKRYEKFAEKHPDYCKVVSEDKYSMKFSIDPKCFGFYPRAPRVRIYSEEEKEAIRTRLAAARNKTA